MPWLLLPALFLALHSPGPGPAWATSHGPVAEASSPEDAVYVYDLFQGTPGCADLAERLKKLPLRSTVILSVEQGTEFVLDRPQGEIELACALEHLPASTRKVKALFLQDPSFLRRGDEAERRARLLGDFAARHAGQLSGVQIDVEPYAAEQWSCAGAPEHRGLLRDLHGLLRRIRPPLRGLSLGAVVAWWYPAVARELPEAAPEELFRACDEIYLLAYGDEGGPLVGGSAERVLSRVDAPEFFSGRGRVHLALAAYEYRSPGHLERELETVRRRLAPRPTFAGTAVFHAGAPFDVPLVRIVTGSVSDQAGRPLPEVEIEAASVRGRSNLCGQFTLRGLPESSATVILGKPGFRARKVPVQWALPGAVRDLGNIKLERKR